MISRIALWVCVAHSIAQGSETRQKLTACLQFETAEPYSVSFLAQGLAVKMFADIGISLQWRTCKPVEESPQAPIVVVLASGTAEEFKPGALGYAMPYQGRYIKVFLDR